MHSTCTLKNEFFPCAYKEKEIPRKFRDAFPKLSTGKDPLSCSHVGQNDIVESVESEEDLIIFIVEYDYNSSKHCAILIDSNFFPPIFWSHAQFPRGILRLPFLWLGWATATMVCVTCRDERQIEKDKVDKNTRKIEGSQRFETPRSP